MTENEIATVIVDAAYRVHTHLGPGLLESVYETAIAHELMKRGMSIQRQQGMPVVYDTIQMELGFRADLIVSHKVIIEIKSIDPSFTQSRKERKGVRRKELV